ncbi:MAG: 4Fe-4S binding protein, partial [Bacteroidales bacterium]|nr:4Fe-4S binding protein [Bacteroidales bacterium]
MLKKIRFVLALLFWAGITLMFLDFSGTLKCFLGWMAKIQFLPAILALNIGAVLFVLALTLLFGRLYCSIICPMGVFQDFVSRIAGKFKKRRFKFTPEKRKTRLVIL